MKTKERQLTYYSDLHENIKNKQFTTTIFNIEKKLNTIILITHAFGLQIKWVNSKI